MYRRILMVSGVGGRREEIPGAHGKGELGNRDARVGVRSKYKLTQSGQMGNSGISETNTISASAGPDWTRETHPRNFGGTRQRLRTRCRAAQRPPSQSASHPLLKLHSSVARAMLNPSSSTSLNISCSLHSISVKF